MRPAARYFRKESDPRRNALQQSAAVKEANQALKPANNPCHRTGLPLRARPSLPSLGAGERRRHA